MWQQAAGRWQDPFPRCQIKHTSSEPQWSHGSFITCTTSSLNLGSDSTEDSNVCHFGDAQVSGLDSSF